MHQEEIKKETSFEFLRSVVENAVENRNTSTIEKIEDENQLIYMQKYFDLINSKRDFSISSYSLFAGMFGLSVAVVAIGISVFLSGITSVSKTAFLISGGIIMSMGFVLIEKTDKIYKKFKTVNKDIDFELNIALKIEEQLILIKEKNSSKK